MVSTDEVMAEVIEYRNGKQSPREYVGFRLRSSDTPPEKSPVFNVSIDPVHLG